MRKYIIMGVQGSGKGTQAKLLAERLDLEHISVGDIFRWSVQHHTKLGAQVRRSVAAGELAVILLEVPDRMVRDRILSRRLCSECGIDCILIFHRPATAGVCDVCGGELVARADDTPEAVEGRLRDYHDKTRPVLELFRAKEVIVAVDATSPVEQVQAAIGEQLGVEMSSV
jgi:adenylate kinase